MQPTHQRLLRRTRNHASPCPFESTQTAAHHNTSVPSISLLFSASALFCVIYVYTYFRTVKSFMPPTIQGLGRIYH